MVEELDFGFLSDAPREWPAPAWPGLTPEATAVATTMAGDLAELEQLHEHRQLPVWRQQRFDDEREGLRLALTRARDRPGVFNDQVADCRARDRSAGRLPAQVREAAS